MKRTLISAALIALSAPAMAVTCTSQTPWSSLGPPGTKDFGRTFSAAGSYTDCYTFTLNAAANSDGTTIENNVLFDRLYIDVTSVSLFSGGVTSGNTAATSLQSDNTPDVFSFSNLGSGTYTLVIASTVYNTFGLLTTPVGYTGNITTKSVANVASALPEGEAEAMALIGLLGVGGVAAARRRMRG